MKSGLSLEQPAGNVKFAVEKQVRRFPVSRGGVPVVHLKSHQDDRSFRFGPERPGQLLAQQRRGKMAGQKRQRDDVMRRWMIMRDRRSFRHEGELFFAFL